MRRTKIVCTIGPASQSETVLKGLMQAGMDVARLNFSHGDHAFHASIIKKIIRRMAQGLERPVAILQDLQGPKIRVGPIEGDRARLQAGRRFVLTTRKVVGNQEIVSVNVQRLPRLVKKGNRILLGDGEIELEAVSLTSDDVACHIVVGGVLSSHKGIHFPQGSLDLPSLTQKDKRDLAFGIEQGVDLVALSFVRGREDILAARWEIKKRGRRIPIIAKIEKHEALDHLDAILQEADAIMVARGDLGLETAPERIPVLQKMLSEESAVGSYPIQSVKTMAQVALETESILEPRSQFEGITRSVPEAISHAAVSLARDLQVKAFLIPTTSGSTARMIARYRPTQPMIAISAEPNTVKALCLVWGVHPVLVPSYRSTDAMVRLAQTKARSLGYVKRGDLVAITAGLPLHKAGTTNLITVQPIE